jgi:hypothetical protein
VLLVSGKREGESVIDKGALTGLVRELLKEEPGKKVKEMAKEVASEFGVPSRDVYEIILKERGK